ncbi:hypothetical protein JCM33374_g1030 [Metschnikowia sp. JCM 33374]|nr:hypothetical protein JCM33374_g1030 [Metschnikowia sp. JCM 33374]
MRVFLAHLPVWATMVMTMLGLVRAVATKDAFKKDWVHYNSGPLIKHGLLDHQTVAELSQKNVLYMRDIASSKVTSYIDLSLHDSDDFVLGEDSLVTFSKNSTVVSVFEKYSGVFIASITLNAPPVDIQGYRGSGWTILQEAGGENGENGGELVTWYNHKLYSLGTQYGRALSHYTLPQTTYVFTGTDVFSLTENHNEGVSTLRVENVDHGFFYDIAFPPGVVDEVALTNENKSPIYVTNDTAVSYHASDFVIYSTSGSEPTALYRKTFDDIVDMQVSGSTVLLVTQHKAYILDLSKFLQKLTPTSVSIKIVELHPDLHSAVLSGGHFVALNGNGTSLLVHDYDIASGDSSVVPLSVPSFESTGGAIIVNVPPSLAKIEEAHHLVEEARSSSIIHRWLLRTRTHLSQLGQLMAQVVLRKSTSAFSGEEDVFGFNKILVQIDQSHSVVAAKSSKNGDLIWVYDFSADGNIREVKASGSEVYVFFDSSVHILDLRWGKLVSSRAFESPIEKVVSLKTTPSEEEDDLEEPVAPEAIAVKIGELSSFLPASKM